MLRVASPIANTFNRLIDDNCAMSEMENKVKNGTKKIHKTTQQTEGKISQSQESNMRERAKMYHYEIRYVCLERETRISIV